MTLNTEEPSDFIAYLNRGQTKNMSGPIRWLKKAELYAVLQKALAKKKTDAGKPWTPTDVAKAVAKEFGMTLASNPRKLNKIKHSIATTIRKTTVKSKWWPLCEYVLDVPLNTSGVVISLDLARRVAGEIAQGSDSKEPPADQSSVTHVIDTGRRNVVQKTQGRLKCTTRDYGPGGSMLIVSAATEQQNVPDELIDVTEAYSLVMSTDQMAPLYEPRTTLWINPNKKVTPGSILLVPINESPDTKEKIRFVCLLHKITKDDYIGEQFNPRRDVTFSRALWVAEKIVGHVDPEV